MNRMYLILLGAPGSGKGTQSKLIVEKYPFIQISTGDILREEITKKSSLGIEAKKFMDGGKLVPDELIIMILKKKLLNTEKHIILDGFPRNLSQANALDEMMNEIGGSINSVINISVEDSILEERLSGRLVCKGCGTSFHKLFLIPIKDGICDKCGGDLYQRSDDLPESIKQRLIVYHQSTKPLIDFYDAKGLLSNVDGDKEVNDIFKSITSIIDGRI